MLKKILKIGFGWGLFIWGIAFIIGMVAFIYVPPENIGLVILPFVLPLMAFVSYKKLKDEEGPPWLYPVIGIIWLTLSFILDYVILVQGFKAENFYDTDILIYYA